MSVKIKARLTEITHFVTTYYDLLKRRGRQNLFALKAKLIEKSVGLGIL